MYLAAPTVDAFRQISSWIKTRDQLLEWAGPDVTYPFTVESLMAQILSPNLNSFSLFDRHSVDQDASELIAFGQYYSRLDCCHLGRLIVSPKHRGKKSIDTLVELLNEAGKNHLACSTGSLFVLESNTVAQKVYKRLGYRIQQYPEALPFDQCFYMVKAF